MNRIFHARIAWYQYFLLFILTINAIGALWCKIVIPALLLMLFMIIVIEQIVHTRYTVKTDGILEVYNGRFIRKKIVPIKEISSIKRGNSMYIGKWIITKYIVIEYGKDKHVSLMPIKEEEFIKAIEKQRISQTQ